MTAATTTRTVYDFLPFVRRPTDGGIAFYGPKAVQAAIAAIGELKDLGTSQRGVESHQNDQRDGDRASGEKTSNGSQGSGVMGANYNWNITFEWPTNVAQALEAIASGPSTSQVRKRGGVRNGPCNQASSRIHSTY